MRMYCKYRQVKIWGNHIDPQVSTEDYLVSKEDSVTIWARENQEILHQMDRDTINLYRRYMNKAQLKNIDDLYETTPRRHKIILPKKLGVMGDGSSAMIYEIFSKDADDMYQLMGNQYLAEILRTMRPYERRILHMKFVMDMENPDIATELSISSRAVRSILKTQYCWMKKELLRYSQYE